MNDLSNDFGGTTMPSESNLSSLELPEQYVPSLVQSWQSCGPRTASYGKVVSLSPNEGESTSSSSMSPRSEYYRLMYACLQEKFDYVQASTDRLRDRLYHVKKEVTYLKRMKRVLIRRLARYAHCFDGFGDVFLGRCNDSTRVTIKRIPLDALDVTIDIRTEDVEANTRTLVYAKSPDRGQLLR
ncbi:hypothetical protein ANCCAN_21005, partial [Ancylostoma caninum]